MDELRRSILYLLVTQDTEALQRQGLARGGEIMTHAEELLAEGEQRAEHRANIQVLQTRTRVLDGTLKSKFNNW